MTDTTKRWLDEDGLEAYALSRSHPEYVRATPIHYSSRLRDCIDYLCSRLDAQQEVIDKLPKTRDGVVVVPEIIVYVIHQGRVWPAMVGYRREHERPEWWADPWQVLDDVSMREYGALPTSPDTWQLGDCYSTRAAAEAAQRGADAAPDSSEPSERAKA